MDTKNIDNRKRKGIHPRKNANVLSSLFYCWTIPIFIEGYKRDLNENDLYDVLKEHDSHILGSKLEIAWTQERTREKPSLTRAIWKVFGRKICFYGVLQFVIEFGAKLAQPLCLGKLMQYYIQGQKSVSRDEALIYGSLIVVVSFINVLLGHNHAMGTQHLGMKLRVACSSLIYRQSLKLSRSASVVFNTGKITNMLASDVGRFDTLFLSFHNIWAAPIQIIVVTCLLYFMMGVYALAGIVFFILFIPVQILLGKQTSKYRLKTAGRTDERVRLTNEIINGIQVIKMYAWEKPFAKLVEQARKLEIKAIRSSSLVKAINASVSIFLNRTALYFAVLAYTLAGNNPQAYYVFVVTSFYNILRQPMVFHIPHAISSLAETSVAIKRIEEFLLAVDVADQPIKVNCDTKTTGIFFHDVFVRWNSSEENVLSGINLSAKKNELVAITGPVGSGKSTLFQVILKELPITTGVLDVNGTISYASQEPWLFTGTIKENILFGEEMNLKRYQEVCRVCALQEDFSFLPHGDQTVVGDRGVKLSGGQKARVNLARTVYKDADIYLLDDPLSAVDMHVGKQLYDNCISSFLKGKCVVLITHQVQYLKNVHRIYVIKDGVTESCETFDQFDSTHKDVIVDCQQGDSVHDEETITKALPSIENKEQQNSGDIKRYVYGEYIKAGGGYRLAVLIVLHFIVVQFLASSVDYFLAYWINLEEKKANGIIQQTNTLKNILMHRDNCIYLYSFLICSTIIVAILRSTSFMQVCINASKRLYYKMSASILNTDIKFFYINPVGRILNRFSKDIGLIDEVLPLTTLDALQILCNLLSITILVAIVNPWIIIPTVIILSLFYWLKIFFLASSQNLKRMEATARSPVYSHLSDTMHGLTTVRALKAQQYLIKEFEIKQNCHNSAFYLFMACNRTFGYWLDFFCVIYVSVVTISLLIMLDETTGGNMGLAITQSLALPGMLQWGIRQWTEMENQMTAVERVVEYTDLKPETDNNTQTTALSNWPSSGSIQFKDVCLTYNADEPFVLNNINIDVTANEKIGIVGRTGAGKSSLIAALFRLVEIEGQVYIDNMDTKTVPLHSLRSRISIIPQDPILLHGTLRTNLDPFQEYKDEELWAALETVNLRSVVDDLPGGLYSKVFEGGSNFSVGQKQLLCIARALLRKNKILVLDEATSNVDPETDALIQSTIREKFSNCTVLAIAHRLQTVMDSDRIIVLKEGSIVECDHPYKLLQNKNSEFYSLLNAAEHLDCQELLRIAEENYQRIGRT